MWFDNWRPLQDQAWASTRFGKLQQLVEHAENKNAVAMSMTRETAETICSLAENDPSVPLLEAKHFGMPLAKLKEIAKAQLERKGK